MTFDRGRIIVAPFKFTDVDVYRVRPLLVMSDAAFEHATGNVVAAMITTARQSSWPFDVEIPEWETVGLSTPCLVRMKLFTIASGVVRDTLGQLRESTGRRVADSLDALLFADRRDDVGMQG